MRRQRMGKVNRLGPRRRPEISKRESKRMRKNEAAGNWGFYLDCIPLIHLASALMRSRWGLLKFLNWTPIPSLVV